MVGLFNISMDPKQRICECKELLKKEDLTIISDFFSTLPEIIQVVWGFEVNENLASDKLAIGIIATEPRFNKE